MKAYWQHAFTYVQPHVGAHLKADHLPDAARRVSIFHVCTFTCSHMVLLQGHSCVGLIDEMLRRPSLITRIGVINRCIESTRNPNTKIFVYFLYLYTLQKHAFLHSTFVFVFLYFFTKIFVFLYRAPGQRRGNHGQNRGESMENVQQYKKYKDLCKSTKIQQFL